MPPLSFHLNGSGCELAYSPPSKPFRRYDLALATRLDASIAPLSGEVLAEFAVLSALKLHDERME